MSVQRMDYGAHDAARLAEWSTVVKVLTGDLSGIDNKPDTVEIHELNNRQLAGFLHML